MDRVVIAGGTGFIGLSLASYLKKKGFVPVLIGRNRLPGESVFEFVQWDSINLGSWVSSLEGAFAVVNLAGKSVDCIKTPDNCDQILRSRVESTRIIGKALSTLSNAPKVWIQMSTAHIYGDPPETVCTESSATGYGLAPTVGQAWEKALLDNKPIPVREVRLRTSFVMGRDGGALSKLLLLTRLGLGGTVGHGQQGMSWIHEEDMNCLIYQSIVKAEMSGVYVASSPNPVSQKVFMKTLRKCFGMPIGLPAPKWLARLGARMLFDTDPDLILYGRYVVSERLEKEGFVFKFPDLESAIKDLLEKK